MLKERKAGFGGAESQNNKRHYINFLTSQFFPLQYFLALTPDIPHFRG
jgi:hypothetical protein